MCRHASGPTVFQVELCSSPWIRDLHAHIEDAFWV